MGTIPELRAEKESPLPAPEGRASVVQMVRVVAHPNCDIPLDLLINADAGMRRHSVAPVLLKALLVPTQRRRQHLVSSRLVRAHDLLQPESPLSSRARLQMLL